MPQNRKRLIELFIGNLSNAIVHQICLEATDKKEIAFKYKKELETSFKELKKSGEIKAIQTDITNVEEVENLIKQIKAKTIIEPKNDYWDYFRKFLNSFSK